MVDILHWKTPSTVARGARSTTWPLRSGLTFRLPPILPLLCACAILVFPHHRLGAQWKDAQRVHHGGRIGTRDNIHLALPFNDAEPVVGGVKQAEVGVIDYVWGASQGGPPARNVPGGKAWHEYYYPWGMDSNSGHTTTWFLANHPDWLEYSDAHDIAYLNANDRDKQSNPALDMTNPAVRQYVVDQLIDPALQNGFQGVSIDIGVLDNMFGARGHFDAHGAWVRQYSGRETDRAWMTANEAALRAVVSAVKERFRRASITMNEPLDCGHRLSDWEKAIVPVNQVMDESGMTVYGDMGHNYATAEPTGYCRNYWLTKVREYRKIQQLGKGLVLINEEPYKISPYESDRNPEVRFDLQWALANYLLVKDEHTYVWFGGSQQYGTVLMQHEYAARIRHPVSGIYRAQGVFMRRYSTGLVIVNPSDVRSYSVGLPARAYRDLYGHWVRHVTMVPHSGMVLLKAG